jgi:3-hydroxymyristoyl/3-hydroxydecanoyl-(acyl carrier protein) dehydratase
MELIRLLYEWEFGDGFNTNISLPHYMTCSLGLIHRWLDAIDSTSDHTIMDIDNCRFKRQVKPGDQLHLTFDVTRIKGQIVKGKGIATVNNELVCEAEIMVAFSLI